MPSDTPQAKDTVIVATSNAGKLIEIRSILGARGLSFCTASELGASSLEVEETGETFADNALLKARAYAERFNMPALADDSGLEVDALHGAPGVFSARYAGSDGDDAANNAKLLREMVQVPSEGRTARFRCAMVLVWPDGRQVSASGVCEGSIARQARGEDGFGYDPLFLPVAVPGRSMAELTLTEKNAISHRGAALRSLRDELVASEL